MQCPNCGKDAINVNGRYVCLDCGIELASNGTPAKTASGAPVVDNHAQLNLNEAMVAPAPNAQPQNPTLPAEPVIPIEPAPIAPSITPAAPVLPSANSQNVEPSVSAMPTTEMEKPNLPPKNDEIFTQPKVVIPVLDSSPATPIPPTASATENQITEPTLTPPTAVFEEPLSSPIVVASPPTAEGMKQASENPAAPVSAEPIFAEQPPMIKPENPIEEPVKDYYLNALNQDQEAASAPQSAPSAGGGNVVPDFPTSGTPGQPVINPVPTPTPTPTPSSPGSEPAPSQPSDISIDGALASSNNHDSPQSPPASENISTEDSSFFQPQSLDITPPISSESPSQEKNPAPETTTISVVEANSQDFTETNLSVGTRPLPTDNSDLDVVKQTRPEDKESSSIKEALNDINSVDAVSIPASDAAVTTGTTPVENFKKLFSKTASPPTTENIVGVSSEDVADIGKKGTGIISFKWLWIILEIIGGIILVGVLVYSYMYFKKSRLQQADSGTSQGQILTLSQDVGGTMDEVTDVSVSYEQTLDFSKTKPKDATLALFFSKPTVLKESFNVDKDQDIALDSNQGETPGKRTYIKAEGATYVYSNDIKVWVKTDGLQLSPYSIFYPVDPKGALFYLTKVESMQESGSKEVDGKILKKIIIKPKKETIGELLTNSNPAFAKINYTDLKTDKLNVVAWINDKNQIVQVTVSGSVNVSSDIYNGVVVIAADGSYDYQSQDVKKP